MSFELPFIGLLLSLAFIWATGLYPGGIIVPSYLVLFADQPERIAGTLIAAVLALVTYNLSSRYLILFGKRRVVMLLLAGGLWAALWRLLLPSLFPLSMEYAVIGWVIPGLIANHCERQGVVVTAASLVTLVVLLHVLGRMMGLA